jgi:glutaconate CoA-transferase, subunit B
VTAVEAPAAGETIAVLLSRQLRDGWVGVTPYSPIISAACLLARRTHAPALTFWVGTLGMNPEPERLYRTGTDPRYLDNVEAIRDFYDVFEYGETGCDYMFYSGLQIDRFGNANNVRVGGPGTGRPLVVGGGQANTSHPVVDGRFYLFHPRQSAEVFVPKVDFVSVAGFLGGGDEREALGLPGGGPALCVTDLAVLDFDPRTRAMRLASVHPGVSAADVRARIGFPLPGPDGSLDGDDVPVTVPPTEEELAVLRGIDRDGVLREL